VFEGGDEPRSVGTYIPMMQKRRIEHHEVLNARYLEKKGKAYKGPETESMDVDE